MRLLHFCFELLERVEAPDPTTVYLFDDENGIELEFDPNQPELKTIIEPNVVLRGKVQIKKGCWIKSGSEIANSVIGEKTIIHRAFIEDSTIGAGCEFGPGAQVKRCYIAAGVKMKHQAYLGDAVVGEGCNIGHQTSTANFGGAAKNKTIIGRDSFIGDSVKLVPPIIIGDEAFIADGVIRRDIPSHALVVGVRFNSRTGRFEEVIKLNRSFKINGEWILKK